MLEKPIDGPSIGFAIKDHALWLRSIIVEPDYLRSVAHIQEDPTKYELREAADAGLLNATV